MTNLYFPISGLFCIVLVVILFFSKERIETKETKIYGYMILSSLIDTILVIIELLIAIYCYNEGTYLIIKLINKIDFITYVIWPTLLFLYVYYISYNNLKKYENLKKILIIFDIWAIFIEFILPIKLINSNGVMGVSGLSPQFVYGVSLIYIAGIFIILLLNLKSILKRKYVPLIVFIILTIITLILRIISPTLIIIPSVIVYINLIMYNTIENPDVKMIEQLELARNQADKANKAKTEFLSNMSHEIRTPLNAIVGFSECMIESKDLNEEIRGYAKDIVDASQNLLEIVNGILDISKIEANKMDIIPKDYNPKEIFISLEKLILPRLSDKPIELKTYISDDLPGILNGDVSKLKQIVLNILTNAAKYTDKGEIIFNVSCINKIKNNKCLLFISIKDTGRGIKKENINKLFDKFERIDEDKNTTIEGTGLGLAITKRLVEMLGGKINVFSVYGEGSNFTICLEQNIVSMEPPKEEPKEIEIDYEIYKNKKVLIVDDSNINLKVAIQVLKPYEFLITTATSGFEAIEKVKEEQFDLILMDIMMPKMNGVETLKKLKENENFKTPTIALTADAIEGTDTKYINEGFDDYLSKPINKDELNRVINKFLGGEK